MKRRSTRTDISFFKLLEGHRLVLYMMIGVLAVLFWRVDVDLEALRPDGGKPAVEVGMVSMTASANASKTNQKMSRVGVFRAYTSRVRETDSTPYITADGTDLRKVDYCVVANNTLDFDTVIEVEHLGECVVKDRMQSNRPNNFDVYFRDDLEEALKFGVKRLRYRIVRK